MTALFGGLKLTHDGAVAVLEENRLRFSVEAEKLDNRPRYSAMNHTADLTAVLALDGLAPSDLHSIAVDGWGRRRNETQVAVVDDGGTATPVEVAGYADEPGGPDNPLLRPAATAPLFGTGPVEFRSYSHATGHALAGYCSSPFAEAGAPALIVVWDGGMPPCLYHYDPQRRALRPLRWLSGLVGGLYPVFASHLSPFRSATGPLDGRHDKLETLLLPVSGKAMAYAALGRADAGVVAAMRRTTAQSPLSDVIHLYRWCRTVLAAPETAGVSEPALMASMQEYVGETLLEGLREFLDAEPAYRGLPLCLSGGCALNIKWNAQVRAAGLVDAVWVPPFPNDAGSAIGTACAEMIRVTGRSALSWSVFSGPELLPVAEVPAGWTRRPCDTAELGRLLADTGDPVVLLSGRAEIGPRALGHRSIIAPATSQDMHTLLNRVKDREGYRPVAPICLEDAASEIFEPGVPDPYMLFEHRVRPEWAGKVPAVVHIDGSARLQTVDPRNRVLHEVLTAYAARTGIPVLANTSANHNGRGFFPDVTSALRWGRVPRVWANGVLYTSDASPS